MSRAGLDVDLLAASFKALSYAKASLLAYAVAEDWSEKQPDGSVITAAGWRRQAAHIVAAEYLRLAAAATTPGIDADPLREARAAGLRDGAALRKYGTHLTSCACRVWTLPQPPCDCGLEEALAAPGAAPAPETAADLRTLRRMLPVPVGPNTTELWLAFGRIERALGHGIYSPGAGSGEDAGLREAPLLESVRRALTSEDEIAHGEAWHNGKGLGRCAYCDAEWPCRTQRGINALLAVLAAPAAPTGTGTPLDRIDVDRLAVAMNTAQIEAAEIKLGHDLRVPASRIAAAYDRAAPAEGRETVE